MSISPSKNSPRPIKLKLDKMFRPCPLDEGDEAYPNGIFEFNITRLLTFIDALYDRARGWRNQGRDNLGMSL
jgi:hypothetical protein